MASQDWIEKDFYKILGVSKDVSEADLKKTYRKLAKDNHPDLHPGDAKAEARFKDIFEAYDVLSDPERHDALVQNPNPEVTEAVVADVIEPGYLLGERMLRPAKVAVFVPAE